MESSATKKPPFLARWWPRSATIAAVSVVASVWVSCGSSDGNDGSRAATDSPATEEKAAGEAVSPISFEDDLCPLSPGEAAAQFGESMVDAPGLANSDGGRLGNNCALASASEERELVLEWTDKLSTAKRAGRIADFRAEYKRQQASYDPELKINDRSDLIEGAFEAVGAGVAFRVVTVVPTPDRLVVFTTSANRTDEELVRRVHSAYAKALAPG